MRAIDADEYIAESKTLYLRAGWGLREIHFSLADVIANVEGMPTVDVVTVTRCKDCKYYRWECDMCDEPYSTAHNVVYEDDYCSRAERKEE